jgi:N-carbamoyl-D-amino-acid hydrolase
MTRPLDLWVRQRQTSARYGNYRLPLASSGSFSNQTETGDDIMTRKLRIAAAQLGPVQRAEPREVVVKRLVALMREAHGQGAQFIVFPELALTTFFPRWWVEDQAEVDRCFFEESMPSPATQPLFDEGRRLGVGFYLGYAEIARGADRIRRFNTTILVAPDGEIVGKYRKIHLPGHADHKPDAPFQHLEKKYFEVGDLGFRVWRFMDAITGMLICNDRRWPEAFRVLALQGAELVAVGFNTPTENPLYPEPPALKVHHHLIMAQAMAYQNATWLVETAKCGTEDGFRLFGNSVIVAPTGEIAARTITESDEVICYSCDLDLAQNMKRTMFNFAAHRRPEHYRLIVERVGAEITPAN